MTLFRRSLLSLCALLMVFVISGCSEDTVSPVVKNPILTGPGSIGFGDVALGACKDTTIRYDNTTGKTITLTSVTFAGAGFEWTGSALPVEVAAGTSIDLKVRYCPVAKDSAGATLVFKGTGGDSVAVKLTGNGLDLRPLVTGPLSIKFSPTEIGACRDTIIRYDNTTSNEVSLTDLTITGSGSSAFQWMGDVLPSTIAVGGSIDIKIRFCASAKDSAIAVLNLNGLGGQPVQIRLTGTGTEVISNNDGPTVGSIFLYDFFLTNEAGVKVPGSDRTLEDEVVETGATYKGKSDVFVVLESGELSYYAIESNGDVSVYVNSAQGGPFGGLIGGWKTLPYGSKRTNVTLMTKDTVIEDASFPAPITVKVKQTASYTGETSVKIGTTTYTVENVTFVTSVDLLLGGIIPVGNITNTVQAGFIRSIGYQANFDAQVESTVQGFPGEGSRKKLKSFVIK